MDHELLSQHWRLLAPSTVEATGTAEVFLTIRTKRLCLSLLLDSQEAELFPLSGVFKKPTGRPKYPRVVFIQEVEAQKKRVDNRDFRA